MEQQYSAGGPGLRVGEAELSSDVDDSRGNANSGLLSSAKQLVVVQKRKFPKMLPWGDPPGTVLGLDLASLTFTVIFLPYKKAATQSIVISDAPSSAKAIRHCS